MQQFGAKVDVDVIKTQSTLAMKDAFGNDIVVLQPNALQAKKHPLFCSWQW